MDSGTHVVHKRSIQEAIPIVAKALRGGVCEDVVWSCLVSDKMSEKNADIVIRWAKQFNLEMK